MQLMQVNVVLYYIYYYKLKNISLTQKNKKQIKYNIPLKSVVVRQTMVLIVETVHGEN